MHIFDQLIGFFKRPSRKELEDKIANLQEQVFDYQKECWQLTSALKRKTYNIATYKCNRRISRDDLIACSSEQMEQQIKLYKTLMAHEFVDKILLDDAIDFYTSNDIQHGSIEILGYLQVVIPREKHLS